MSLSLSELRSKSGVVGLTTPQFFVQWVNGGFALAGVDGGGVVGLGVGVFAISGLSGS